MMRRNGMILACPTDDMRSCPAENTEGSESGVVACEKRERRDVRRVQCFIRPCKVVSDLTEITKRRLGR